MSARACAGLVWIALAACSTPSSRSSGPVPLGLAQSALAEGDLELAERDLSGLFVDGLPIERAGDVFWAGWMLASAHADLALAANAFGADGGVERMGHTQAALFYARSARATQYFAADDPPEGLEFAGSHDDAALALDLLEIVLLARLGFAESAARLLETRPGLMEAESAQELTERARLGGNLAVHLTLALFEIESLRAGPRAFELAVGVLEAADRHPGVLDREAVARVEDWIRTGSEWTFRCPECRQAAVPELRACPNDQTPLAGFFPERRR
jgi:hypothetical protein